MLKKPIVLLPEDLRWTCSPTDFNFKTTTDEIPPLDTAIGQERAVKALDFGLGLESHGFNIYVLGDSGTGKTSIVKAMLEKKAKGEKIPDDWCYIYNFKDADMPNVLNLPAGVGIELKIDMEDLVESLKRDIPKVFESKDYEKHRDEMLDGQQERTKALFYKLEQKAQEKGFIVKKTVSGLAVVPAKNGKVINNENFDKLSKEEKIRLEEDSKFLQDRLSDAIREARGIEKDTKEKINALDREVVQYVVNPLISELLEKYKDYSEVINYLGQIKEDVLVHSEDFRPKEELAISLTGLKLPKVEPSFEKYSINLFVNNKDNKGAPVIIETNPTYYNLFGRIEHRVQYNVATTDFTMIKAGSIHKANGGYLVINALDLLRNIFAYDALKRMINNREVKVEDVWEQYRLVSTTTLKPEPIPVDIKIVLIGNPQIYYMLYNLDDEYKRLFKVKADFDSSMNRNKENIDKYCSFIAARCKEEGLKPFDKTGVARIIEYGARLANDQEKLTAKFSEITDIMSEANYWAGVDSSKVVEASHVDKAVSERVFRNSRIEERIREIITNGTILIDTDGAVPGQVNGIAVLDLGDYAFGKPSRITAKTFLGDAGIVNIEREVKMSGRIHNKALMILTSHLGEKFAQDTPLTLSASICFEQLYDEIEGDSATCTEFYALMSSLSGLPLNQGIAVTGSMNQQGEVQPVGGLNEKIEGFFDVCAAKGLTGRQGVIIPKKNVRHLMLKKDVVEAVRDGKFTIYPIEQIEEGIEVLTGKAAGEKQSDGAYPEGTINFLVAKRLMELAKTLKEFGNGKGSSDKKERKK